MFDQASMHSSHKIAYTYLSSSLEVPRNILLKKWGQSDVDPKEFKRIIGTSSISKFQPYRKHQVLWFFDPLHNHSSPEQRAIPLLPTWIYSCRSRVTVSCTLPFTTNVTISTFISQTFLSWIAICHLRQPMVFYLTAHMPGLAHLVNALF